MFAGKVHDLRHLGFGHFVGIDPAFADAVMMHMQHDSGGGLAVLVEKPLQHVNHELHRRVIVVQQQNPIKVGPLGLRFGLGDDRGAGVATLAAALALVVAGEPQGRGRPGLKTARTGRFGGPANLVNNWFMAVRRRPRTAKRSVGGKSLLSSS